jgi:putative transposase
MLAEGESGVPVDKLCRKNQISSATYYKLRSKYSGMSISELKRLKELETENRRLKAMYAEISLEHSIVGKKAPRADRRRLILELTSGAYQRCHLSLNSSCKLVSISKTAYYHKPKKRNQEVEIECYLRRLAQEHKRWGFNKMMLKAKADDKCWNHKRVYRIYCRLGLNIRIKPRKRIPKGEAKMLIQPIYPNICWSADFMSDVLFCGRKFRTFNVIDDYNREGLLAEPGASLPANKITMLIDQIALISG